MTSLLSACAAEPGAPPQVAEPQAASPAVLAAAPAQVEPAAVTLVASQAVTKDPTCDDRKECAGESCCARIAVPGGTYHDVKGEVAVASFELDKFELTVGRVQAWVRAGRPLPVAGASIGRDSRGELRQWQPSYRAQNEEQLAGWERYDTYRTGKADLPKNFLDWPTAVAVCHYAGGRLPSDAEWRYAAQGGDERRPYPWGTEPQTPAHAAYNCNGDGDPSCTLADLIPVGSRPLGTGRWGHQDLAGSVFEWTVDAHGAERAVSRGGGFCYIGGQDRRAGVMSTGSNLRDDDLKTVSHMVGARCAYDIEGDRNAVAAR